MTVFEQPVTLGTWRCGRCKALLARVRIVDGTIEIKCRRCDRLNTWPLNTHSEIQPLR